MNGTELRRDDLAIEGSLEDPVKRIEIKSRGFSVLLVLNSDAIGIEFGVL